MFGKSNIEIHPNLENYLKAIWQIAQSGQVVRVKDLATALGLKNGTVVSGLRTLAGKGLVIHQHYGHVELTQKGTLAALHMVNRHAVLLDFLGNILKLTSDQAERDACALEHYISGEGLHRLIHFAEFIRDKGVDNFLRAQSKKWRCPNCGGTICCHNRFCYTCDLDQLKKKKPNIYGVIKKK